MQKLFFVLLIALPVFSMAQRTAVDVYHMDSISPAYKQVKLKRERAVITHGSESDTTWREESVLTKKYDREGRCTFYEVKNLKDNTTVTQKVKVDRSKGIITLDSTNDGNFTRTTKVNAAGKPLEVREELKKTLYTNITVTRFTYDSIGRLTEKIYELETGTTRRRTVYFYSEQGLPSRTLLSAMPMTSEVWEPYQDTVFYFDRANKLIARVVHDLDYKGVAYRSDSSVISYDGFGRVIREKSSYNQFRSFVLRQYDYDMDGKLASESLYTCVNGDTMHLSNQVRYEYDARGFVKKRTTVIGKDEIVMEWRTLYNQEGLPVSTLLISDRYVYRYTWTYKKR